MNLVVNEIYLSLQGESTFAGLPCIFIRLTGCDLRCSYCDTAYAFTEGQRQSVDSILERVGDLARPYRVVEKPGSEGILPLVELTGGEPLLQPNVLPLMSQLCNLGNTVLIETSGAHDISKIDPRVRRIMDFKCPGSGEERRNLFDNVSNLKSTDEIKFVIGSLEDYAWARSKVTEMKLWTICPVLFSWVHPLEARQRHPALKTVPARHTPITRQELAEMALADHLPVRFQLQQHKIIWSPDQRGV